ncbi:hypothetical protein [Streptomyces nigrescens]|uniref:hypothetical protein n=1 Tax=Streptomyces nigrescens TaxID=1920 RepID=UPI0036FE3E5E
MTSNHARKNKARRLLQRVKASYTSANAGTLHHHPGPDLGRLPTAASTDMSLATALVAARLNQCSPCEHRLSTAVLEKPQVLAHLSEVFLCDPRRLSPNSRQHPQPQSTEHLQAMAPQQRSRLLAEALDLWAGSSDNDARWTLRIMHALPVLHALRDEPPASITERHVRALVSLQRSHGQEAVRTVWHTAHSLGKITVKTLAEAAEHHGYAPRQMPPAAPRGADSCDTQHCDRPPK